MSILYFVLDCLSPTYIYNTATATTTTTATATANTTAAATTTTSTSTATTKKRGKKGEYTLFRVGLSIPYLYNIDCWYGKQWNCPFNHGEWAKLWQFHVILQLAINYLAT